MYMDFSNVALISKIVANLRNKDTQPPEFRKNLFKLGRLMAYEVSKTLPTVLKIVASPFGEAEYLDFNTDIVIVGILRACLPMAEGVFDEFPDAIFGLLSASRGKKLSEDGKDFEINAAYVKIPPCKDKIVLVVDPMLATASTMLKLLKLIENEKPTKIIIIGAIAAKYGIDRITKSYPHVDVYTAAIDPKLNEKGYIIPGLGDAGDRAFNTGNDN